MDKALIMDATALDRALRRMHTRSSRRIKARKTSR